MSEGNDSSGWTPEAQETEEKGPNRISQNHKHSKGSSRIKDTQNSKTQLKTEHWRQDYIEVPY